MININLAYTTFFHTIQFYGSSILTYLFLLNFDSVLNYWYAFTIYKKILYTYHVAYSVNLVLRTTLLFIFLLLSKLSRNSSNNKCPPSLYLYNSTIHVLESVCTWLFKLYVLLLYDHFSSWILWVHNQNYVIVSKESGFL